MTFTGIFLKLGPSSVLSSLAISQARSDDEEKERNLESAVRSLDPTSKLNVSRDRNPTILNVQDKTQQYTYAHMHSRGGKSKPLTLATIVFTLTSFRRGSYCLRYPTF